jgi:dipeptidyl aminopeptidase/acylaminoacyl peptidase
VDPESGEIDIAGGNRSITEISFSPTGRDIATITTDTASFSEIEIFFTDSMDSRWKSEINSNFFLSHEVASLEKFSFERVGMEIEVRVWFPPNFDPGKKYPLLLDVHGGPHSSFFDAFYPIHQVCAGAGYVVVAPNPRGSSTYGAASIEAVHGDWGGEDFRDVMNAMEEVAKREYIDEKKVVIHGSSYGGFMSSWAVGHTDRFRAAVIAAPVTNLSSFYGTSDIGVNFSETQLGGERFDKLAE